jgi:hypothetical protein
MACAETAGKVRNLTRVNCGLQERGRNLAQRRAAKRKICIEGA